MKILCLRLLLTPDSLVLSIDLGMIHLAGLGESMTDEELACEVVEKILQDLETTIETLQKIKKKFEYFHSEYFSL